MGGFYSKEFINFIRTSQAGGFMKNPNYWKTYPVLTNPEEIELALSKTIYIQKEKSLDSCVFIATSIINHENV
jgi:hypothetical protein